MGLTGTLTGSFRDGGLYSIFVQGVYLGKIDGMVDRQTGAAYNGYFLSTILALTRMYGPPSVNLHQMPFETQMLTDVVSWNFKNNMGISARIIYTIDMNTTSFYLSAFQQQPVSNGLIVELIH
jgi:hypothetical protein